MSLTERLDRFQQKHPWASFPIAVAYKFFDDQGVYLAALISYYGFLSLFPTMLLLASVLGFVLQGEPELQQQILDSALSQFPVIGSELEEPQGLQGSTAAVVIGGIVALYGALGVAQATQNAMNVCWAVPRHQRPNPILSRLRSLLLIGIGGLVLTLSTVLSAISTTVAALGVDAVVRAVGLALLSVLLNAAVFTVALRISTVHPVRSRQVLPGALTAAVGWQLLQSFGTVFVGRVINTTTDTYGVFALVLGLLGWIFLAANVVVLSVEVNVVRVKELYPRALLTPFTDDVDLTEADEETYADAATAQRAKDFENVEVSFEPGSEAPGDRPARST